MTSPTAPADAITPEYPGLDDPPVPAPPDEVAGPSWFFRSGNSVLRFGMALLIAAAVFSIFMIVKGVNPLTAYADMIHSVFRSPKQIGEVFIRATPIMLAGLAVAIPARAGLINVGGEGQLIVGGVAAAGVALAMGGGKPGWLVLLLMILGGAAAGAAWAAIAAVLRLWVDINEAVSTLLLNYIAIDLLGFLIYSPWKDQNGSGQPTTPILAKAARLPVIGDSRVHVGILIAVALAVVCWFVLKKTSWGFRLRVTGGNQEAARRAGMSVGLLLLSAMLVGGALAGLGGFAQYAGTEFKLRPGFCATYGYLGFLASWLAGHRPIAVAGSAILLSAIAIGGDSLQIDSGLPAASVNILIALVLLAMFGLGTRQGGVGVILLEVLTGAVRGGTTILYAGLGETVSERGGVVNLGIEGSMLCGALAAVAATSASGNPWVGALAGALAGAALAAVHAFFVINRRSNQLATGLVVLFLGLGITSLFGASYVKADVNGFEPIAIPGLSSIPWLGDIFFDQDPLTYISYALVPALWWFIFRSRWGVLLRAAGERSEVLTTYGHRLVPIRYAAVIAGGFLAGVGGAQLSIAYANAWFENMVQGRGFIAVAVVIFAARQPFKVAAGAYLFGAALALSPVLQANGYSINQFALDAIPYVLTLVVLVVLGRRRAADAPEELQKVFEASVR